MKKVFTLVLLVSLIMMLSSCNPVDNDIHDLNSYCSEYTKEEGKILVDGIKELVVDKKFDSSKHEVVFYIKAAFEDAGDFHEGLAYVKIDGKYGFIDKSGTLVIPPRWHKVEDFKHGTAIIQFNNKYGLIDSEGNILIEPEYDYLFKHYDGEVLVTKGTLKGIYDIESGWILYAQYNDVDSMGDEHYCVSVNDRYGVLDLDKNWVIELIYEDINLLNSSLLAVKSESKFGIMDLEGNWILDPCYEDLYRMNDNLAVAKSNDKYGVIDFEGNWIIDCAYEELITNSEELVVVKSDGLYGIMNIDGSWFIEPTYVIGEREFSLYLPLQSEDGDMGLIDYNGNFVDANWDYIDDSHLYNFYPVKKDDKWGFVKKGEVIFEAQFDKVIPFYEDTTIALKNNKVFLINKDGQVVKQIFDEAEDIRELGYNRIAVDSNDVCNIIDFSGNTIGAVPLSVHEIFFHDDLIYDYVNGKTYLYDINGEVALAAENGYFIMCHFSEGLAHVIIKEKWNSDEFHGYIAYVKKEDSEF